MSIIGATRPNLSRFRCRRATPFFLRRFSSSDSTPPPPPDRIPIQTVSYAVKPKPEPPPPPELTMEDIRYMKDSPRVSYARKDVAPLPEDRVADDGALQRERARIESDSPAVRRVFRVSRAEELENELPFPTLIKVDKKSGERPVFDLQDAIRRVKGVNGAVVLPHGIGKNVRVAVFAEGAAADEARAAGADIVGGDELIEEIRTSGKINFDKCIATHSIMERVTKISRVLRALTPNAKKGSVTNNVTGAVREAKQGLLDFRMKDSIVHVGLGKVSFTEEALQENVGAFVNTLLLAKPPGLKKTSKYAGYVNSFHLCSTMGPGFTVSIQSLSRAADTYSKLHPK